MSDSLWPQASPSMGLPRQEYWSGLPFLTGCVEDSLSVGITEWPFILVTFVTSVGDSAELSFQDSDLIQFFSFSAAQSSHPDCKTSQALTSFGFF